VYQEALSNVVKHSRASSVVALRKEVDELMLEVQDNGKGFDLADVSGTSILIKVPAS
jgi:signal transduction histidine kinase